MRRLPPLNALRAFEAAARHLSFTRAAAELNVTQGAVSRHVKGLEDVLGVRLFERRQRGLELTREGAEFLPRLTDAFDRIAEAAAALGRDQRDLRIKVLPTFAVRWLIPRLARFQDQHPDIAVRLTTSWHEVDFVREDFDAGIVHSSYLRDDYERRERLTSERLVPVCSPLLPTPASPLDVPADLARHTLLHGSPRRVEWRLWLQRNRVRGVDPDSGLIFDIDDAAWRAAASGIGVALADLPWVQEDLAAGRLVRLFDRPPMEAGAYYLVYPARAAERPKLLAFRSWLLDEAAASDAEI